MAGTAGAGAARRPAGRRDRRRRRRAAADHAQRGRSSSRAVSRGSPVSDAAADSRTHGGTHAIVALDTALRSVVVALAAPDGTPIAETTWEAGYRHGDTLLPSIQRVLGESNVRRSHLRGVVVGTGPGAFTGLRVGLATAKGRVHALGLPIVGGSTGEALLTAA